ncbi:MAG: hypothetical protein HPY55_05885 [Firmicutes bacterium]|nr:hypothetical protein [Bacillota bacterium]
MDVFEAIAKRRSIRNFTGEPVPDADLLRMVECARLAPAATNAQKWHFVITTDRGIVSQILSLLPRARKEYPTNEQGYFDGASAIITVLMPKNWLYAAKDAGAAIQTILLAATAMGHGACWVDGQLQSRLEDLVKLVGVPGDMQIMAMVMVGKALRWPEPPPKKAVEEVTFWQVYGHR